MPAPERGRPMLDDLRRLPRAPRHFDDYLAGGALLLLLLLAFLIN